MKDGMLTDFRLLASGTSKYPMTEDNCPPVEGYRMEIAFTRSTHAADRMIFPAVAMFGGEIYDAYLRYDVPE